MIRACMHLQPRPLRSKYVLVSRSLACNAPARSHGLKKNAETEERHLYVLAQVLRTRPHLFAFFQLKFNILTLTFLSPLSAGAQSPCRCTLYINEGKPFLHAVDLQLSPTYVKYVSVRDRNKGTTNLRCYAATFADSAYPGYVRRPNGALTVRVNRVARLHNTYPNV